MLSLYLPSLLSSPSSPPPPPGSHSHHHAGVQKLLRWVCPSPSASHAAHAEGVEEGKWIESSAPFLTPSPHTHAHPLILKITMFLCAPRSLLAYNIKLNWNTKLLCDMIEILYYWIIMSALSCMLAAWNLIFCHNLFQIICGCQLCPCLC